MKKLLFGFAVIATVFFVSSIALCNGFKINQSAGTSWGNIKRYIDLSSPWSGGYIFEDFVVEGRAEIHDSFTMINISPCPETISERTSSDSNKFWEKGLPGFSEAVNTGLSIGTGSGENDQASRSWLCLF